MTEPFRVAPMKPLIPFEWLDKIDVRVGTVEWVGDVQGSDRLVRLLGDCGDRKRQALVGMKRERPDAKELQGRRSSSSILSRRR
jgi:tRNA-binding EMAP/Myf-like protein